MATLPPETILPRDQAAPADAAAPEALAAALAALHGQAAALAMLARIAPEPAATRDALGAVLAEALPWQRALVAQTVADSAAMLETGLAALAMLARRGQDCAAPALVLWREFHAARAGMIAVLDPAHPA
jgi:hypothetical protein